MTTTSPASAFQGGRSATKLAGHYRDEISNGRIPMGQFMPSERELAGRHGLAKMTVRRAMKILEAQGLVSAEPRQGYRVVARPAVVERMQPVAYIAKQARPEEFWDEFHTVLMVEFQKLAGKEGWSLLMVSHRPGEDREVLEQIRAAGAFGAILDSPSPALMKRLTEARLPAVQIDIWNEIMEVDTVAQDGFIGGYRAVQHLLSRGHRRFGWFGATPIVKDLQIPERRAGAEAALRRAGLSLDENFTRTVPLGHFDRACEEAKRFLSHRNRPRAVISLWQEMNQALAVAARDLGLRFDRDIDMVGWSTQELYASRYREWFQGNAVPAAVTWCISEMAHAAMRCLRNRRREPDAPICLQRIPVRLQT